MWVYNAMLCYACILKINQEGIKKKVWEKIETYDGNLCPQIYSESSYYDHIEVTTTKAEASNVTRDLFSN